MKLQPINNSNIPEYVTHVTSTLENAGFEAFLVGGCVRDLMIGREVKDWDITTNANPEEIIPLFEKTIYENKFGTVGVCIPKVTHETNTIVTQETVEDVTHVTIPSEIKAEYHIMEVTPYRTEAKYSDNRHPDEVKFSKDISEDLQRRDFTINAMAYNIDKGQVIDLYKGQQDLTDSVIRAVGASSLRFQEDGLRMLRAVRFTSQLGFMIDSDTMAGAVDNSHLLKNISGERIRDEFIKIIESPRSVEGVGMLQKLGLLKYIIPELEEGIGCDQGGAHIYDVFTHCLGALGHATDKGYSTNIRLAALFHDIGKPRTKRNGINKPTFYGHEVVGARMTRMIMERLKFPKDTIEFVSNMVRRHMFFSDTEQITLSAVRRVIQNVRPEHIWELMEIRECDRVGMKKAEAPYRLRKYHAMIEECLRDPISVGQLVVDGNIMREELGVVPGRRMGWILHALLEEVLEDPTKNTREYLDIRVRELNDMTDETLKELADKAKELKDELENEEIGELRKKHNV
ncbi:MAG: CCA tRNA nucleotidyltransferase [Candidatus Nomurabacteria bacterium]|nr:CCA tRNA nucleotidyltransferase [Candidatus Nomurabacteria bacterium]